MAILEMVLTSTYFNQLCINRWNYVSGGTPAAVLPTFALASAIGAVYDEGHVPPEYPPNTLMWLIARMSSNQVHFQQVTVLNVYDPTDFYQTPFVPAYNGAADGEGLSPAVAYGFRTNQVRRDIARATKRFVGATEDRVTPGGVLAAGSAAIWDDLAVMMSDVLEYDDEGNTLTFAPAVCSKLAYDVPQPPPKLPTRAYKYYPTLTEQLAHTATGITWEKYSTVRTQTSRQYGKGV